MQMADEVAVSLYDLEDAAYDAKEIREFSESDNHVPIIDAHGGRTVRVRGHAKVLLHLILGLLVIAVEQSAQML